MAKAAKKEILIPNPFARFYSVGKPIYDVHQIDNVVYVLTRNNRFFRRFLDLIHLKKIGQIEQRYVFKSSQHATDYYNFLKYVYTFQNGAVLVDGGKRQKIKRNDIPHMNFLEYLGNVPDMLPAKEFDFKPCLHSVRINYYGVPCVCSLVLNPSSKYKDEYYGDPIITIAGFKTEAAAEEYYKIQHDVYRNFDLSLAVKDNQELIDYMNKICKRLTATKAVKGVKQK